MTATPQSSKFDIISPTALLVAYARQFSDIPYASELAKLVDAQTVVEQYVREGQAQPVIMAALIEARYKAVNSVLARFGIRQIVELASGLLPRGITMSENPEITFVESDLPAMVNRKQQLVRQLIGERPNLHFEAIDATHVPSVLPIHANYLNPEQPVAILCEGLLMYLTLAEKQQVCANVREMLRFYGGVWITPDIITLERLELVKNNPAMQQLYHAIAKNTGRLENTNFETVAHAKQFFQEQGFQIQESSLLEFLDKLTCLEPLGIAPDVVKPLLAATPVFALTVA